MNSYLKGCFKNLRNPATSLLTIIDHKSIINHRARINRLVKLVNSSVGKYSYVGEKTWLVNTDVGNFCSISWRCNIGLASHSLDTLSTSPIFTEQSNGTGYSWTDTQIHHSGSKTIIGNDVWIGYNVLIKAGVTVGDGAVIGAGSIVTKDIPPYAIVAGVPAKVIRFRFPDETINKLLDLKWWNLPDEMLKSNIDHFQKQSDNIDIEDMITLLKQ